MSIFVSFMVFAVAMALPASAQAPGGAGARAVQSAMRLFDRYVALEKAFDATLADLYSDDAIITNKRTYSTGEVRELRLLAPQYKALIRQAMPMAKQQQDTNRYSDCVFKPAGNRVEITCERFSERKRYTSPIRLVVGPDATGEWLIREEHSESVP